MTPVGRARNLVAGFLLALAVPAAVQPALAAPPCEAGSAGPAAGQDHPLACRFFTAGGEPVGWEALVGRLRATSLVLLGEVHDNPDHHRIRGALIGAIGAAGGPAAAGPRPPALVFEHIRGDQDGRIQPYRLAIAQPSGDAAQVLAGLRDALDWQSSGWPAFDIFAPLFAAAATGRHPVIPGDPPKAAVRQVAREGLAAVDAAEQARLHLDASLPPRLQEALLDELAASHCGLVAKTAFAGMATAQRYRDAHQAAALAAGAEAYGQAVLLAGNGHVRADRGVPWHLLRFAPGRRMVTVVLGEVDAAATAPQSYLPRDPDGRPAADYVFLAPARERADPCIEMRRQFKR